MSIIYLKYKSVRSLSFFFLWSHCVKITKVVIYFYSFISPLQFNGYVPCTSIASDICICFWYVLLLAAHVTEEIILILFYFRKRNDIHWHFNQTCMSAQWNVCWCNIKIKYRSTNACPSWKYWRYNRWCFASKQKITNYMYVFI